MSRAYSGHRGTLRYSTTLQMARRVPLSSPGYRALVLLIGCIALVGAAACGQPAPETVPSADAPPTAALHPNAAPEAVATYLLDLRKRSAVSRSLAQQFPELAREAAYQIQHQTMQAQLEDGEGRIGWKMGGTRVTSPDGVPDPSYGYSLASQRYKDDAVLADSLFVGGTPLVEAEIAFWIGKDLPGPSVSREELVEAVEGISGAVELISQRMLPASDQSTLSMEHAIADNLSHGGTLFGAKRVPLSEISLLEEAAFIEIDGVEQARGQAAQIMGGDPVGAVLWLANELPKHGLALRAGDFVVTGSLYDNPSMQAGQRAEVQFSTLGTIRFALR